MHDTGVAFVKMPTGDLDAAERFYTSVFGFRVDRRISGGEGEDEHTELVLAAPTGAGNAGRLLLTRYVHRPSPTPGEWVVGLTVGDMEAVITAALEAGASISKPVRYYPAYDMSVALITDPEGNVIELMQAGQSTS